MLCSLLVAAVLAPAASAQQPALTAPVVIDGPSSDLAVSTGLGMSIARDGTGGLVYLKQAGGALHVFAASLVGGAFEPPVQLDSALPVGASSPVIAAGNGGLLLVAFVSGGQLYVVEKPSAQAPFGAPAALIAGAASPSISISNFGKAYLAFTVSDGSGYDVRAAYYYNGRWSLESTPLNATSADNAGTGTGRPMLATAGDGVAVVAWGEGGAIYTRRVWATSPSTVYEQADAALPGCTEASAGDPVVGTEGDSSYADVAFVEQLSCGGQQDSRVLMNRLRGSVYDGLTQPDGLSGSSSDGAVDPQIAMGEYGRGLVTSQRTSNNNLYATLLGSNGSTVGTTQVNSLTLGQPPDAVTATAGLFSDLIAWEQSPGGAGAPEIRVRYSPDGSTLGPEIVLSSPTAGASNAADGLATAGDVNGDAAVAWLQGTGPQSELLAARLYQPPGGFAARHAFQYQRTPRPTLAWSAPKEAWGPVTYTVTIDGAQIGQTTGTSFQVASSLADGPHAWQVSAANPAGQASTMRPATVFLDTTAPTVTLTAPARARTGARVVAHLAYADAPPAGDPVSDASGVATVLVHWGDGSSSPLSLGRHAISHDYARAGAYTIIAVVKDAAGNTGSGSARLHVVAPRRRRHRANGGHR